MFVKRQSTELRWAPVMRSTFLFFLLLAQASVFAANTTDFYFVDVGLGNATLIVTPSGETPPAASTGFWKPSGRWASGKSITWSALTTTKITLGASPVSRTRFPLSTSSIMARAWSSKRTMTGGASSR